MDDGERHEIPLGVFQDPTTWGEWVDIPGTELQVMIRGEDLAGTIRVRGKVKKDEQ